MICPRCGEPLTRYQSFAGLVWQCARCGGRAVALSVLRKAVDERTVRALWVTATQGGIRSPLRCPSCQKPMRQAVAGVSVPVTIDVCELCQFVWTDAGELEQMPPAPPPPQPQQPDLPPEAKEALAMAKVEALSQRTRRYGDEELPDSLLHTALLLLGLPVEEENFLQRQPWMTWLTAFTITAVSLIAFFDLERAIRTLALVPAEWWRYGGITLFTSFFVHGSIFHLLSNLYFLVVFGDNVEDFLGHTRFLLLLTLSTLVGDVMHIAFDPRPDIPCIGASGGISGVVLFYALAFPHAKLYLAYRWYWFIRVFSLPAWVLALIWVALQLLGVAGQMYGASGVSALAHLGGAAMGFVYWLLWRNQPEPPN
ncbi:MAG: rhomboid family intramembrane serine protease [Chthonomonadetes bacterium]|nr:rhomboid family intramembrane serine protease [Chthonomonadetes bacterium]